MPEIISCFLSSTLRIVLDKVRNKAADKLKDGDVAKERLRQKIIEDLNEIKTKIDGLARKDLNNSLLSLKLGVRFLNTAIDESRKAEENVAQVCGGETKTTATATKQSITDSSVLNEAMALSNAIQKLNNTSSSDFGQAKEQFQQAYAEASKAFSNEALTIQERVMAAKLLVVSCILKFLQDTKSAVISCKFYLEELHNLPAIGEIFSAYFKGEIKARFYKAYRLEIIKSVLFLNFAVSEFIARFSGELPDVRNWPKINLPKKDETIHPLILWPDEVEKIFKEEEIQSAQNYVRIPITDLDLQHWGINSKGQLIGTSDILSNTDLRFRHSAVGATSSGPCLVTFNRSGSKETFCQLPKATANSLRSYQKLEALTIDRDDNVYVIMSFDNLESPSGKIYVLFVFDSRGYKKSESVLSFVERTSIISCAVTNERDIIIHFSGASRYYVCNSNGILKSCVPLESSESDRLRKLECVTNRNEMIMRAIKNGTDHVLVYTIEGKLKREIKVAGSVVQVTYDYATSRIQVLTKSCCYIDCYPETDVGCERLYLHKRESQVLKRLAQEAKWTWEVAKEAATVGETVVAGVRAAARIVGMPKFLARTPLPCQMLVSHPHGPTAHLCNDDSFENIMVIFM